MKCHFCGHHNFSGGWLLGVIVGAIVGGVIGGLIWPLVDWLGRMR